MIKYEVLAEEVQAKFAAVSTQSPEMKAGLLAFANVLANRIKLGFRAGKSPTGTAWKPLHPTLSRKGQPLRNTGRLQGSVVAKPDGNSVLVGTNLKLPNNPNSLGAVHQFGMTITPKKGKFLVFAVPGRKGLAFLESVTIPARPFMPLDAAGNTALPPAWEKAALTRAAAALGLT